jgi:hypothetical protein
MTIDLHVANHVTVAALFDDFVRAEVLSRRALSDADIVARIATCLSHGHVRCWSEWQIAERVAWSMPSVTEVHNHLVISNAEAQS